ncbi:patatin-like phospholipase family protein [Prevotella fusca]|uniref:Patatin family protein n=1 Tax=Prevotella fusca JCM 17724 TaxID=1236517 RepID=A0A0K1NIZ4_9BACT|nr:patatin family protein [Prevotella fusca]AKU68863.1 serine protease [Prevotella fusca JCM 17724]QUB86482.1 patatin family protein [Prevotella fusca JCM 17724]
MKKGLVLEGGAMRGLFSAGVMDVLMENDIWPDGVIGVSAGAAFGCNMKSKQPGRVLRYNQKLAHDWRYASLRSLLTTGDYFGGEYAYHYMPRHIDYFDVDTFRENPMEFWAVCTNVGTGKAEYKRLTEVDDTCLEYIRASASMPIAARIVTVEGKKLLDGGIADSIPLRFFREQGYERNLVVLTQPEGYVKKQNSLMRLMRMWLHRHPRIVRALENRHIMYNEELAYIREEEKKPNTLVLRPKGKLTIGHISHDPAEMQATYEQGREVALEKLEEIKALFEVKG